MKRSVSSSPKPVTPVGILLYKGGRMDQETQTIVSQLDTVAFLQNKN